MIYYYMALLCELINKLTTGYFEEKKPRTPVVSNMAIQFWEKKWRTRLLNETLRVPQASYVIKNTSLQRNCTVNKGTKAMIFISLKIFPKPAKMLHTSCNVNFSQKHPCTIKKNCLVVYASQYPASRGYIFAVWAGVRKVASADNRSISYRACAKFVTRFASKINRQVCRQMARVSRE